MSQPQKPGSNILTLLLLATTIFLGLQLLTGGMQQRPDTRSADQIWASMVQMNAKGRDVSIQAERRLFETKFREEAKKANLAEPQIRQRILESWVLTMHTSTKAGVEFDQIGRLSTAFNILDHEKKAYGADKAWSELKVPVAGIAEFPKTEITAAELYDVTIKELNELNKKDMIWGFFPGYAAIDALVKLTGSIPWFSYTFAAFLLALIVRAFVWPLAQKQLMFSRQMMQLQPLAQELRKKYSNKQNQVTDQAALQRETMQLYADYGVNPAAGCAPALVQIPFFLLVFQAMMHYRFEFNNGVFLWVNPGTSASLNGLVAPNLGQMDYILLVIYGVSMVIATYLQPVTDPNNAKQQRYMGIAVSVIVTISMFFFPLPSAFVLYWIFLNIFSTLQSLRAYRLPVPPLQKVATGAGGVRAKGGFMARLMEEQQKAMQAQANQEKAKADKAVTESDPSKNGNGASNGQYKPTSAPKGKKKNTGAP